MTRQFKITDESTKYGSCFVVREYTLTGPILDYQWERTFQCTTREEAENFIREMEAV